MKFLNLAMTFAAACGLSVTGAFAQSGLRQPAQPTGYDYYAADEAASPSDKAPAQHPADAPPSVMSGDAAGVPGSTSYGCCNSCNSCNTCNSGCDSCCETWFDRINRPLCGCCCCDEGWRLFGDNEWAKCHDLVIDGYMEAGVTGNDHGRAGNGFNGPVGYDDRANEFQMNQLNLSIQRMVDMNDCDWNYGGKVEAIYGTDARFLQAYGLEVNSAGGNRLNSSRFYQLALPEFYSEVGGRGWDLKSGHYFSHMEYEQADPVCNFFYTHSYGYLYGVPTTLTGFQLTRTMNDQVSWMVGVNNGWNQFEDFLDDDKVGVEGGLFLRSCDGCRSFSSVFQFGDEYSTPERITTTGPGVLSNRFVSSNTYSTKISDRLTFIVQGDYGSQDHAADGGANDAHWYSFTNYAIYRLNCNWWLGARADWFRDEHGTRVTDLVSGNTADGPFAGDFYDFSLGLNYKPNCGKNLIVRPEFRYDKYVPDNGGPAPFVNGTHDNQVLFAVDAILRF